MFLHTHPYKPFLFKEAKKLIVGTMPPPRFTTGKLKPEDVDFCYGSKNGQLWPILDSIFRLNLKYENTHSAIQQRKEFLVKHKIGVCDIVRSALRQKIDASDLGMQHVQLRNLVGYLKEYPNVNTLLFTGGNSKNGPEYFFRRHLKENGMSLSVVSNTVPRIHEFKLTKECCEPENEKNNKRIEHNLSIKPRVIKTVSLTAPSGAANRAVGSMDLYKKLKRENPNFTTFDFRVLQYKPYF